MLVAPTKEELASHLPRTYKTKSLYKFFGMLEKENVAFQLLILIC
jgi:hypothetical protein